jgi:ribosomal protein S18 acetylase RimI-like enzyme
MSTSRPGKPEVIHRWTLELDSPAAMNPRFTNRDDVVVRRVEQPLPVFNRFLHEAVGREFRWDGRDDWTDDTWTNFVDRSELETWVLYVRGTPAGYFETEHFDDGSARIHNFGLMRPFFGQGLGAHLLSFAARRAFERGATRVWLQTCTKDHPHALPNYQARGFRIIHEEDLPPAG